MTMLDFIKRTLPRDSKFNILDAAIGARRWELTKETFAPLADASIDYIELNAPRAQSAKQRLGDKIKIFTTRIDSFYAGRLYDVIYVDVLPRSLPQLLPSIVPAAASLLRQSGLLILNLPVAPIDNDGMEPDKKGFDEFSKSIAGNGPVLDFANLFGSLPEASLLKCCDPQNTPIGSFRYQTIFMQFPNRSDRVRPFMPGGSRKYFSLDSAIANLQSLNERVEFVSAKTFTDSLRLNRHAVDSRGLHFLKHDIHADLLSAFRLARAEAEIGVSGAFFLMPPHQLSKSYADIPETIDAMLEIQGFGHEVGVHVDALEIIANGQDFFETLRPFLDKLRSAGLNITLGNTHGNTSLAHLGVSGNLVFAEALQCAGDTAPDPLDNKFAGAVSLAEVSKKLGIHYWFDAITFHNGERTPCSEYWLGDNYRKLSLYQLDAAEQRSYADMLEGENWEHDPALLDAIANVIAHNSCTHLMHPQFYR